MNVLLDFMSIDSNETLDTLDLDGLCMYLHNSVTILFCLYISLTPVDIDVGLELTSYMVAENFRTVEVCVTLQRVTSGCAIGFPFSVNLSTIDGSAGIKL